MAFAKDDAAARLEGYEPIDLHQSGNVCFALKAHHVELTVDDQRSPAQVVEEVLQSPRLGNTVAEVHSRILAPIRWSLVWILCPGLGMLLVLQASLFSKHVILSEG